MAEAKFNLKNKKSKTKSLINLIFNFNTQRLKISTGISIPVKYWSESKQRVKELIEFPEYANINQKLNEMDNVITKIYFRYQEQGIIPDTNSLKNEFLKNKDNPRKITFAKNFWHHFDEFVEFKKKSKGDVRDYDNSLRKHLKKTEEILNHPLSFELIKNRESSFFEIMDEYLTYQAINSKGEKGLTTGTVGKQFKNLKVFLNWCFDRDIYPRFSLKIFVTKSENVDNIYLTEKEVDSIVAVKLEDKKDILVRDLFIIGCETALRFSDFTNLTKDCIIDNEIHFRPKKTLNSSNKKVIIPISTRVHEILKKYKYIPPTFKTNSVSEFNKTIRNICKEAKITSEIKKERNIAGKNITEFKKKYEEVSSHTCRRTFCTLKFLKGMPAQAIMKFSGHTTERNFLRYLKLDAELTAKKYADYFK